MASWLKNWFRGASRPADDKAPDFSAEPIGIGGILQTDVHCHLIPGVDDGVQDLEEALAIIGRLQELGYTGSVLTSHIYSGLYPNNLDSLHPGFSRLQEAVSRHFPSYRLHLAAEYYTDTHFMDCIASDQLLWFPSLDASGQSVKCVLFEFGFHEAPMQVEEVVFQLLMNGYQPVLAHVERYPYWHRDFTPMEQLHERGVWLTLNAASLAGAYGPETYAVAKAVLDKGWCQILCSDAHGMRHIDALASVDRSPAVQQWATGYSANRQKDISI